MTPAEAAAMMAEAGAIDAGQAAAVDEALNPAPPGGELVQIESAAMEWFIIPKALAWAITTVFPETKPHYTDAACLELAGAIAPVAEKYGLNGPGDSPELTLLMATGMFCVPGYLAYKQRKDKNEADALAARKGGAVGPGDDQSAQMTAAEVVGQHGR